MADNELGLADIIVGTATQVPTADAARRKTQGIMRRSMPDDSMPDDSIPSYVNMLIETIRNERGAMDYLKETTDVTRLDDYEYGVDEQAQRMIDSTDTQYDYSSGERPPAPKTPELRDAIAKAKGIAPLSSDIGRAANITTASSLLNVANVFAISLTIVFPLLLPAVLTY